MAEQNQTPLTGIELENFNLLSNPTNVYGFTPPTISPKQMPPSVVGANVRQQTWKEKYAIDNQEDDVFLDMDMKLPTSINARLGARRTIEDKAAFLYKMYGNARLGSDGNLIVRVLDKGGNPRDVRVSTGGWDAGVQTGIAVGGIALDMLSRRPRGKGAPKPKPTTKESLKELMRQNIAASLAGTVSDMTVRTLDSQRLDPNTRKAINSGWVDRMKLGEIAQARGTEALAGLIFDAGIYGGARALGKGADFVTDPFGGAGSARTEMQNSVIESARRLENGTGVQMPITPGMSSGNPILSRAESFLEETRVMRLGDKGEPIADTIARQSSLAQRAILDSITPSQTPITKLSNEAAGVIDDIVKQQDLEATTQRVFALNSARDRVIKELRDASGSSALAKMEPSTLGALIREEVTFQRDLFKEANARNYGMIKELNNGEDLMFKTDHIVKALEKVKKSLASVSKQTDNLDAPKSKLFGGLRRDLQARAVLRQVDKPSEEVTKEMLHSYVPAHTKKLIDDIDTLKGGTMSLDDLQRIRRIIFDDIGKGASLPNVDTHDLNVIAESISQTLADVAPNGDSLGLLVNGNKNAKNALRHANEHYLANHSKFRNKNIASMFSKEGEEGFLTNRDIAEKIILSKDANVFDAYKAVVGKNSDALKHTKAQVAEIILEQARDPHMAGQLNVTKLAQNLHEMGSENPELLREIFGPNAAKIAKNPIQFASFLERNPDVGIRLKDQFAQGSKGDSVYLDGSEFRRFLDSDDADIAKTARNLFDAEQKMRQLHRNRIVNAIRTNNFEEISSVPHSNFIDIITSRNIQEVEAADLKKVMAALRETNPDVHARTRRGVLEKFLSEHQAVGDVQGMATGSEQLIDPSKVAATMKDKAYMSRVKDLVGEEPIQHIIDLAIYEAGRKGNTHAGSLVTANQIAEMMQGNMLRSFPRRVKYTIIAAALESDRLRPYITGEGLPVVGNTRAMQNDIARLIPLSTEVLSGLADTLTAEEFAEVTMNFKHGLENPEEQED